MSTEHQINHDNQAASGLSMRAFTQRHPDWKYFVLGCVLYPPFLLIGLGLVLMGLLKVSTHDT